MWISALNSVINDHQVGMIDGVAVAVLVLVSATLLVAVLILVSVR